MTVAQHLNARLDFEQALFRRGKQIPPSQKIPGNGLRMPAAKHAAREEGLDGEITCSIFRHQAIDVMLRAQAGLTG